MENQSQEALLSLRFRDRNSINGRRPATNFTRNGTLLMVHQGGRHR
jgi:hypothetical protein